MSKDRSLCYAPQSSRVIWFNGNITPCCVYSGSIGNCQSSEGVDQEKVDKLVTGLKQHGKVNECEVCWQREKMGSFSTRQVYQQESTNLNFLEFNFSNLCHLKCRMCNGEFSSSWIKDHSEMSKTLDFLVPSPGKLLKAFSSKQDLYRFLDERDLNHVKYLIFKGGEPLLHEEVSTTLDYFKKRGKTDLEITFSTSGQVPLEKFEIFQDFARVDVNLSVEGLGETYKYIRGGDRFDIEGLEQVIRDISKYKNFRVVSNAAISAYSFFNLAPLFHWIVDHFPANSEKSGLGIVYPVTVPEYVSYKAIPADIRQQALVKASNEIEGGPLAGETKAAALSLLKTLLAPDEKHESHLFEKFKKFTFGLDGVRGESLVAAIPEYGVFL